jgi:hypothetical protein
MTCLKRNSPCSEIILIDSRYLLISGAVRRGHFSGCHWPAGFGLPEPARPRRKAIGHYAGVARRTVRKQRLQRRLREPDAIAAVVVAGVGLAAACARLYLKREHAGPSSTDEVRRRRASRRSKQVVEVDRPLRTVYDQWTQFEEFRGSWPA